MNFLDILRRKVIAIEGLKITKKTAGYNIAGI
jgi:hypothetical protein